MPSISADQLNRRLAEGKRGGIFYLHGDNEFLKEEATARLVAAHLDPATRDFNFDQLSGQGLEPETLASIANTPPMMAEWRVVVVRDAQALAAAARTRAPIEAQLERRAPDLALILVATVGQSRAQFFDRLKKEATAIEFAPLADADIPGWLIARAEARGIKLDSAAARALAGAIGDDLGILVQELGKLEGYVGEKKHVTRADVEALVGALPRQDRWEWFDLVGAGQFTAARRALPVLFDQGESGVGLVIGLGSTFLRIGTVVHGGERALADVLPFNQKWLAQKVVRIAKKWSAPALEQAVEDLLRADRLLKSSGIGERAILEELLLRLEFRGQASAA